MAAGKRQYILYWYESCLCNCIYKYDLNAEERRSETNACCSTDRWPECFVVACTRESCVRCRRDGGVRARRAQRIQQCQGTSSPVFVRRVEKPLTLVVRRRLLPDVQCHERREARDSNFLTPLIQYFDSLMLFSRDNVVRGTHRASLSPVSTVISLTRLSTPRLTAHAAFKRKQLDVYHTH